MSSLKTESVAKEERSPLNTTINKQVFDEFKIKCKVTGIPMNALIEVFMKQYNSGEFKLRFAKDDSIRVDLE